MSGNVGFIIMLVAYVVFVTVVGAGIGLMAEPDYGMQDVEDISTWSYLIHGLAFFFNLLVFRVPDVPVVVNMLFVFPFMAGLLYIVIRVVRGGG